MSCQQIQKVIWSYMDDVLSEEEKRLLDQHLPQCQGCSQEFSAMVDLMDDLQSIPEQPLPAGFHEELMKEIKLLEYEPRITDEKQAKRMIPMQWFKSMAAALLLVIIVGAISIFTFQSRGPMSIAYDVAPEDTKGMESRSYNGMVDRGDYDLVANQTSQEKGEINSLAGVAADAPKVPENHLKTSAVQNQKIIKKAKLSLEVEQFDTFVDKLRMLAAENGGYIEYAESNIYSSDPERDEYLKEGNYTLRVPKEDYEITQQYLIEMGHLIHQSENSLNVTEQYFDTETRIRMLTLQEERLLEIMKEATKVEDLILLEQRLNQVIGEIELFQSKLLNWDKMVDFSTIEIYLRQVKKITIEPVKKTFKKQLKESFINSINRIQRDGEKFFFENC